MAASLIQRFLDQPILERGISNPTFVNGRILTAQDLTDLQTADQAQHAQLGQALGDGVAWGLEAALVADGSDGAAPVVHVAAGLAINRCGQAISLPVGMDLALAVKPPPVPAGTGLFAACRPPTASVSPAEPSLYLLLAAPDSGYREQVPVRGFTDGKVAGCSDRYAVEGIRLRTAELRIDDLATLSASTHSDLAALMTRTDAASRSRLRNWIAYVCFGTEAQAGLIADPLGTSGAARGAVDAMRSAGQIEDCEVPLALLYWTSAGVGFLDQWAVRRRIARPSRSDLALMTDAEPLQADREARLWQFTDQIRGLVASDPAPLSIQAASYFRYLPAVGILPVADGGSHQGVDASQFFSGHTTAGPRYIEGARLVSLIRDGALYPPIDLSREELIWVYRTREGQQAGERSGGAAHTPYLVFANGQMAARADAHYDASYWDYSNFT
jgi:hypothetical protein